MNIIKGKAAIEKAIASIAGRGKKLDEDIHKAGVACLAHASEHGDTSLLDSLVAAMPRGSRKLALVEWALAYGQVVVLDKKTAKDTGRTFGLDRTKTLDLEQAIENPWMDFRAEPDPATAFDAQAAVVAVLRKLGKARQDGLAVENQALALKEARALVKALEATADDPLDTVE